MTNNEISSELDDIAYQIGCMKSVLRLIEDKIEYVGMIKPNVDIAREFKRMYADLSAVLSYEIDVSDKASDHTSKLSMELFKLDKDGEVHE